MVSPITGNGDDGDIVLYEDPTGLQSLYALQADYDRIRLLTTSELVFTSIDSCRIAQPFIPSTFQGTHFKSECLVAED